MPWASRAATGAVVVSKPVAKKITGRSGWRAATSRAWAGEAMGRMSAPPARACSRERASRRGAFTGTRSMSPKASSVTGSASAS